MTKFLILHGKSATPKNNWFMWLKGKLIGQGHEVWLPQLPHAEKPNLKRYIEFLTKFSPFDYDENTVIIGHSSGAVAALGLLESLPEGVTVKSVLLVSAFRDNLGWESLSELFQDPLDFERIKQRSKQFIFIHSNNDPHVPLEHAEYLSDKLSGKMIIMEGQGHFNTETNPEYKQFPELLAVIESIDTPE